MKQATRVSIVLGLFLSGASSAAVADGILPNASSMVALSIATTGAIYSWSIDDYEGLKQLGYGFVTTAHLTQFLKLTVERKRPESDSTMSFPSGHTSAAFAGASYLHYRYGLQWGVPAYILATVVGYSRVNVKAHFATDVLAGALIANGVAYLFTTKYPSKNLYIMPYVEPSKKSFGMSAHYRFQ